MLLVLVTGFGAWASSASAIESVRYDELHPPEGHVLAFGGTGTIGVGYTSGNFLPGSWIADSIEPSPVEEINLLVVRGRKENREWANAFLLRVDPAGYSWITNGLERGLDEKLNMGAAPILVSFEDPVCAIGVHWAQGGAHNPHHPQLRKLTTFSFYDEAGGLIDRVEERPGHFLLKTAYQSEGIEPVIHAVVMESEVEIAVLRMVTMPCARLVG